MSNSEQKQPEKFWFNLKTSKVERGLLTPAPDRVGPFDTEREAQQALQLLRKRSEQWREQEKLDD